MNPHWIALSLMLHHGWASSVESVQPLNLTLSAKPHRFQGKLELRPMNNTIATENLARLCDRRLHASYVWGKWFLLVFAYIILSGIVIAVIVGQPRVSPRSGAVLVILCTVGILITVGFLRSKPFFDGYKYLFKPIICGRPIPHNVMFLRFLMA